MASPAPSPSPRRRVRDVGRLLTAAFTALIVLLVLIVAGGIWISRDINRSSTQKYVQDAIPLKAHVQDLVLQIVRQQSGLRGYLISARPRSLVTYRSAQAAAAADLRYIRGHTQGHPIMAGLVTRVTPQIAALEAFYRSQAALAVSGRAGLARARDRANQGSGLFARFRATADLMQADTDRFVQSARQAQEDRTDYLTLLLFGGGAVALALAALLAVAVHRRTSRLFGELEEARTLLDTVIASAADGVGLFDLDLRYLRVNEALAAINGVPAEDHVGRTPAEIVPDVPQEGSLEPLRRVRDTGERIADLEVSGRTAADPGRVHHWLASYFPVRPEGGPNAPIVALGCFVVDITERKEAEDRLALLSKAGDVLGTTLGVDARLEQLAALMVPAVADLCTVELVDATGASRGVAAAGVDPAAGKALRGVRLAVPGERAVLLPDPTEAQLSWLAEDEAQLEELRRLAPCSALIVPLAARGRGLGMMVLAMAGSGRHYDEGDLAFARQIARRAGVALDNARLYEEQREIADALQQSLLPPLLPRIPGVDIAARYRPVGSGIEVGGDFYDIFETSDETWAVVIGDVCGKGPRAAELTALARYTIRAAGVNEKSPRAILGMLNDAVIRQRGDTRFLTGICACMEIGDHGARLVVACAGHPPALLLRGDGTVDRTRLRGPLIGIYPAIDLPDEEIELEPGDVMVLYTDGVTEARGPAGTVMDEGGLAAHLAGCAGLDAEAIASRIEQVVVELQDGVPRDDVAILVLRAAEARVDAPRVEPPAAPATRSRAEAGA